MHSAYLEKKIRTNGKQYVFMPVIGETESIYSNLSIPSLTVVNGKALLNSLAQCQFNLTKSFACGTYIIAIMPIFTLSAGRNAYSNALSVAIFFISQEIPEERNLRSP